MPPIKPCKRITCQKPGFAIGKKAHSQCTEWADPFHFFNHNRQTSPGFAPTSVCLKSAKVSPGRKRGIRLVHISPQTQQGETTDTGRGSIRHTKYSRPAAHRKKTEETNFYSPILQGKHVVWHFVQMLFEELFILQSASPFLSSCQFVSAAANIGHNLASQGLLKVILEDAFKTLFPDRK